MCRRLISFFLIAMLVMPAEFAFAAGSGKANEVATQGPRRHLGTIVFAGLAGAVLGLSTLSFYGRPQDRLSNIAVGFAIGVIGGTIYTTYKAATEPHDFYNLREAVSPELWRIGEFERPLGNQAQPRADWVFTF
jgi:hypothetical protein